MNREQIAVPARVLAIGAHPDDIEFGCGASLAKWTELGSVAHMLVLTDGSKGTWDPTRDSTELVATRQTEQRAAALRLGVDGVTFLGRTDGELESDLATRAAVCEVIRLVKPDLILAHDPWKRYRIHPDHRHAGLLAIEAIVAARDPLFFPEQDLEPHRPQAVLLFEPDEIDHVEPVEERDVAARIEALLCHASQWESTMHITPLSVAQQDNFVEAQLSFCREAGERVGVAYGEAFKRLADL